MLHAEKLDPLNGAPPASAVILLHGLGDSGQGLIDIGGLWQRELPDTVFLAPDAPDPCDMCPFGYQWFSGQDWSPQAVLQGVQKAAPALNAYIDFVLDTYGLPSEKLALVGFSQGTMMSLYVGPRREKQLGGILGYSGALIGGESLVREKKSAPPIMLVHGTNDEVVPFQSLALAERGLQDVNMNVAVVECPGLGHSIDDKGLAEGLVFLRRIFGKLS